MKILFLLLSVFAFLISSCAGRKVLDFSLYRVAHPDFVVLQQDSAEAEVKPLRVGILPLNEGELIWHTSCDSCQVLSASSFTFEWNGRLDSIGRKIFPHWDRVYLYPEGAPGIAENDFSADTLLQKLVAEAAWNIKDLSQKDPLQTVHRESIKPAVRSLISQFGTRFNVDYVFLPMQAEIEAWADDQYTQDGRYKVRYLFSLWNTRTQDPLYYLYAYYYIRVKGKEHNLDKGWTLEHIDYIAEDWRDLLENMPLYLEPH